MIKTVDGMRKENPEITDKLENQIAVFKVAAHRAQILSSLQGHAGWKMVQDLISAKLTKIERALQDFKGKTQREVDLLLQEKYDLTYLFNIVDDHVASAEGFDMAIRRSEKELSDRKISTDN